MSDLDAWIRAAVRREFVPTPAEAEELRERMVRAPFLSELSLEKHVAERIKDLQWLPETTGEGFLQDLRYALDVAPTLFVYLRRGGSMAAVLGPTGQCRRVGGSSVAELPWMFVTFSAERDRLITGYQFSSLAQLHLPPDVLWLS